MFYNQFLSGTLKFLFFQITLYNYYYFFLTKILQRRAETGYGQPGLQPRYKEEEESCRSGGRRGCRPITNSELSLATNQVYSNQFDSIDLLGSDDNDSFRRSF